jgi:hypothetical protein
MLRPLRNPGRAVTERDFGVDDIDNPDGPLPFSEGEYDGFGAAFIKVPAARS